MKKAISLVLCLVMVFALAACGTQPAAPSAAPATGEPSAAPSAAPAADPIVIKMAHSFADTHPVSITLKQVAEAVAAESNGAVTLDIYGAGVLGSNGEIAQQMIAGEIDAVISGACDNYASFNPLLYVEDLPFLFEDYDTAYAAYDGAYGEALASMIDELGCHTVSFWENGFRQVTNNVRPVTHPTDMAGLKMRAANATLFIKLFECLGCTVTMVDATELFSALQQGMVDGQENPLTMILSSSYYEAQKYCTLTNHIYLSTPVVFNDETWNSFPADVQELLTNAFAKGRDDQRAYSREMTSTAVEELEAKGMEVSEVADYNEWVTALAPVWDYFVEEYGAEGQALIDIAQGK